MTQDNSVGGGPSDPAKADGLPPQIAAVPSDDRLDDAPAIAVGTLMQAVAQAMANAAHNGTNANQQSFVTAQAATTMAVAALYATDTASTASTLSAEGELLGGP